MEGESIMTAIYPNDTFALAAAHMAIMHYSMRGYLTSCFLDLDTHTYDVTVHYTDKSKPGIPECIIPTSFIWKERKASDGSDMKTLELSYHIK